MGYAGPASSASGMSSLTVDVLCGRSSSAMVARDFAPRYWIFGAIPRLYPWRQVYAFGELPALLYRHLSRSFHKSLLRIAEKATFRIAVLQREIKRSRGRETRRVFDRAEFERFGMARVKYMGLEYTYRSIAEQRVSTKRWETIYSQSDHVLSPLSWLQLFYEYSTFSVYQKDTKNMAIGHQRPKNI